MDKSAFFEWIRSRISLKILVLIPLLTYSFAYIYLSIYHKKIFLFNTIIHEGGTFTLLETIFYASHFLGHIPIYTVLALFFTGFYLKTTLQPGTNHRFPLKILIILMAVFLIVSLLISFVHFGSEDTLNFLNQSKQGVSIYERGGSWNLHFPSTLMLFLLIPFYITFFKWLFRKDIQAGKNGGYLSLLGMGLFLLITLLLNGNFFRIFMEIWTNARYLAHSVRELATFPLIYFPVPLYFWIKDERKGGKQVFGKGVWVVVWTLFILFIVLFIYQCYIPLSEGIGQLAHHPSFTRGDSLPILYLLCSHYFEHVLDSVYFILLCLILLRLAGNTKKGNNLPQQKSDIQKKKQVTFFLGSLITVNPEYPPGVFGRLFLPPKKD